MSAAGIAGPLIVNAFLDAQGKPGELTAPAYQPALLTMVGLLIVGFVANLLIRPVADRFHEPAAAGVKNDGDSLTNGGGTGPAVGEVVVEEDVVIDKNERG